MAKRRILSLVLAAVLLLSLTAVVSAATITETTSYTVLKTQTHYEETILTEVLFNHTQGTRDAVPYSVEGQRHTFNASVFPSLHRETLMKAYRKEGFADYAEVDTHSGTRIIAAGMPSDLYYVYLRYTYGDGTWNVKHNGETRASGAFYSAPIGYLIGVRGIH